jgi:hypothetical protein
MRPNPATHKFQLLEANERYTEIHELSFSDGSATDVDPAVARDRSFMVFGSGRHAKKDIDLRIALKGADGRLYGHVFTKPSGEASGCARIVGRE